MYRTKGDRPSGYSCYLRITGEPICGNTYTYGNDVFSVDGTTCPECIRRLQQYEIHLKEYKGEWDIL